MTQNFKKYILKYILVTIGGHGVQSKKHEAETQETENIDQEEEQGGNKIPKKCTNTTEI
jgi:hypothetical protein